MKGDKFRRMSAKEYRQKNKRQNKYNNVKTEIDGFKFDSTAESRYYSELKLRKEAGDIKSFSMQPKFTLQEGFSKHGKRHRAITYTADFKITHNNGEIEMVDVKGSITQVFRIKEKLYRAKYDYPLTLVKWEKGRFKEV